MSASNYRLSPLPTAQDVINARRWGRFESALVCVLSVSVFAVVRNPSPPFVFVVVKDGFHLTP